MKSSAKSWFFPQLYLSWMKYGINFKASNEEWLLILDWKIWLLNLKNYVTNFGKIFCEELIKTADKIFDLRRNRIEKQVAGSLSSESISIAVCSIHPGVCAPKSTKVWTNNEISSWDEWTMSIFMTWHIKKMAS